MKKWKPWLAVMTLSLGLVGCGTVDQAGDSTYHGAGTNSYRNQSANQTANNYTNWQMNMGRSNPYANANINDQGTAFPRSYTNNSVYKDGGMATLNTNNQHQKDYGYATYTQRDMNRQQASTFYVDRNVLARAVATVVSSIPGVEKANVLVTDEDLVVTLPGVTKEETLNQAKLSAWSMSPRYYKIFVTGDEQIIDEVNTLVNQSTGKLNHVQLEGILKNTNLVDMTGTNISDNGQNVTNYNLNQIYRNTNRTHRTNQ